MLAPDPVSADIGAYRKETLRDFGRQRAENRTNFLEFLHFAEDPCKSAGLETMPVANQKTGKPQIAPDSCTPSMNSVNGTKDKKTSA